MSNRQACSLKLGIIIISAAFFLFWGYVAYRAVTILYR